MALMALSHPAAANDWAKFYTAAPGSDALTKWQQQPEVVPSSGNIERDIDAMYRKGFALLGYSSFSTSNDSTKDAERQAKKVGARYYIVATNLTGSSTSEIPLTLPTATTSYSSGTASAYGSAGSARGTYSGTTTTYGTQTTYIPVTVNRFDKMGVYFAEVPRKGSGIQGRELTADETQRFETHHAFVVLHVRDGSPAFAADLLPGDVILKINGKPADIETWNTELQTTSHGRVEVARSNGLRTLEIDVPEDWRP